MDYANTEPLREFARRRGISPTKVYGWIDSGEIESYLDGKRRYIVVASYDRLVQRLVKQAPVKLASSNPKAKAREAAAAAAPPPPAPARRKRKPPAVKREQSPGRRGMSGHVDQRNGR
jgi:hypothetical protein